MAAAAAAAGAPRGQFVDLGAGPATVGTMQCSARAALSYDAAVQAQQTIQACKSPVTNEMHGLARRHPNLRINSKYFCHTTSYTIPCHIKPFQNSPYRHYHSIGITIWPEIITFLLPGSHKL